MPNEPDERPVNPQRPEIQQPHDPAETQVPQREVPDVPQELPPPSNPGEAGSPSPGLGFQATPFMFSYFGVP